MRKQFRSNRSLRNHQVNNRERSELLPRCAGLAFDVSCRMDGVGGQQVNLRTLWKAWRSRSPACLWTAKLWNPVTELEPCPVSGTVGPRSRDNRGEPVPPTDSSTPVVPPYGVVEFESMPEALRHFNLSETGSGCWTAPRFRPPQLNIANG